MTRPPDIVLREHLKNAHPAVAKLLFCDLRVLDTIPTIVSDVMALVRAKTIIAPDYWMPYVVKARDDPNHTVYAALALRVNLLEVYCRGLRKSQNEIAGVALEGRAIRMRLERRKRRRQQRQSKKGTEPDAQMADDAESSGSASESTMPPPAGDPAQSVDECSHYMHLWLDAHLLLCCAIETMRICPVDGTPALTTLLAAYAPSASTVFHEGELPDLLTNVEACSFFSENTEKKKTITFMLSKSIPHRCVVRDVILTIKSKCVVSEDIFCMFQSMIAASMLGVYRHSRKHPPLDERLRIYRFFFFMPSGAVATAIDEARQSAGVTVSRVAQFTRDFRIRENDGVVPGDYDADRRKVTAMSTLPGVVTAQELAEQNTEDYQRRKIVYGWLTAMMSNAKATQKRYVHQQTVVNVVREYIVYALNFLPHLYRELCARTDWISWQHSVIDCLDELRGTRAVAVLKTANEMSLPTKTLYQVPKEPFIKLFIRDCGKFLDDGKKKTAKSGAKADPAPASPIDGSELPLDAPFTEEMDVVLRAMMKEYPRNYSILPVLDVPPAGCSMDDVRRDFIEKGRFPLKLLYGSDDVIREYRAAASNYDKGPSPSVATGLVRYLSKKSMYQLQLIYAFAKASVDRKYIYTTPLPEYLAEQQASALRERLNVNIDDPIPRHLLTTFVCRHCKQFRATVVSGEASEKSELPPFGSESVGFAFSSIEKQVATVIRNRGNRLATWDELWADGQRVGTLFEWFRRNAGIDGDMRVHPPPPNVFDAEPDALDTARNWFAALPPEPNFREIVADDSVLPLEPITVKLHLPGPTERMPNKLYEIEDQAADDEFMKRRVELRGRDFVVGHWSADKTDQSVIWTCASKKYKNEERKTRNTSSSEHKVADAITQKDRIRAEKTVAVKRRHDVRFYYNYSQCSRSELQEVNMLGYALRFYDKLYVACCSCLGYTQYNDAHWHGNTLLCTRCWKCAKQNALSEGRGGSASVFAGFGASSVIKCRHCKRVRKQGDVFFSSTVLDDQSMRFVTLYLCQKHVPKKAWIFHSPNFQSLSAVDCGIKSKWGNIKRWDANRDYMLAAIESDDAEIVERQMLERARKILGVSAIDGEGEEGTAEDKWDSDASDASEPEDDDDAPAKPKKRGRPPLKKGQKKKAAKPKGSVSRLTGTRRGKLGDSLV